MDSGRETPERGRRDRLLERMSDRYLSLDGALRIDDSNAAARAALSTGSDAGDPDVGGLDVRDLVSGRDAPAIHDACLRAVREQTEVTVTGTLDRPSGRFEFRAYPDEDGIVLLFSPVDEKAERELAIERQTAVIGDIYEVFTNSSLGFDEKIGSLLAIGREALGTEFGTLSRIQEDRYTFEYVDAVDGTVEAGDEVDLSWTSCELVVASEERLVLSDMATEAPAVADREGNRQLGLSCYIGAPVEVDGDVYGTLCFYDRSPKSTPFSEWEAGLVDFMGLLASYELERRRVERRLRSRNEALEQFRSVLSHDLRNPVTVAQGYVDVARSSSDAEALEYVQDALDRVDAIIADVSAVAGIEDDALECRPVETAVVARAAWEMVSGDGVTLEVTVTGDVIADESRLQRLFENLLSNAVTHTDAPVTVEVGDLPGGFYVADTGSGIAPDRRDRAFTTGFTTGDGTGLGLAIVTEIAEAHGWSCELTEGEAGGARFEFTGVSRP